MMNTSSHVNNPITMNFYIKVENIQRKNMDRLWDRAVSNIFNITNTLQIMIKVLVGIFFFISTYKGRYITIRVTSAHAYESLLKPKESSRQPLINLLQNIDILDKQSYCHQFHSLKIQSYTFPLPLFKTVNTFSTKRYFY